MFGIRKKEYTYFDRNPQKFRWLITAFSLVCLLIIAYQSYYSINTPTDENVFADPPSKMYISQTFPINPNSTDSLHAGTLVLEANGVAIQNSAQLNKIISSIPDSGIVRFTLYNQRSNPKRFSAAVQKSSIPPEFARYLSSAIMIVEVTPGGASDRAGIKIGDIIVKVNGESFASAGDADVLLRKSVNSNSIRYSVLRKSELFDIDVTLAKYGFSFRFIQQIVCGFLFLGIGFFIAYSKPAIRGARLLGLGLFVNGFYTALNARVQTYDAFFYQLVSISMYLSFVFGVMFLVYAVLNTPRAEQRSRTRTWLYRLPGIAACSVCVLGFVFGFLGISELTNYMTIVYSSAMTFTLFGVMICNSERRKLFRFPIVVLAVSTISQIVTLLVFVTSMIDVVQFSSNDSRIDLPLLIAALIPVSYLYSVGKFKIYGIVLRFTKSMQYNFFSLSWKLLSFIILVGGLLLIVSLKINMPEIKVTDKAIEILPTDNESVAEEQEKPVEIARASEPRKARKNTTAKRKPNDNDESSYSIELPDMPKMEFQANGDDVSFEINSSDESETDPDEDFVEVNKQTTKPRKHKNMVPKIRFMSLGQPQFDSLIKSAQSIREYAERIKGEHRRRDESFAQKATKPDSVPVIAKKVNATPPKRIPAHAASTSECDSVCYEDTSFHHFEFGTLGGSRVMEILIYVLLSTTWLFLFSKCSSRIQKYLDKKFFRTSFDYRLAQNELSEVLKGSLSKSELAQLLVDKLKSLIGIKNAGVLLINKDSVGEGFGCANEDVPKVCARHLVEIKEMIGESENEIPIGNLNDELKEMLSRCGFRFLIPIASKGNQLALLFVGEKLSETAYRNEDLEFLKNTAGQIYIALENAILYEGLAQQERIQHELELARNIQLASLPSCCPEVEGMDVSGSSMPAFEVGGDFYDYLSDSDGAMTILIGDVSGKGTSAALHMSKTQGIFRTLSEFTAQPFELMSKANSQLNSTFAKGTYVTALAVKLLPKENSVVIARAGHLPLYMYRHSTGEIEKYKPNGLGLGLARPDMFDRTIEEVRLDFFAGDTLLLVTDGITEARDGQFEEYGEQRMLDAFRESIGLDSVYIRAAIMNSVKDFTNSEDQYDDQTLVVVKRV